MASIYRIAAALLALAATAVTQETDSFEARCTTFALPKAFAVPDTTVLLTSYLQPATNLSLTDIGAASCTTPSTLTPSNIPICRIRFSVATSPNNSSVTIEAYLPPTSNYTSRLLTTGNGGISGCIAYDDLAYGASLGFASFGANGGHDGMTGVPFLNNEDVVADFAWRSVHTTANIAKAIAPLFYSGSDSTTIPTTGYNKSYYLSCSTGGRQGFKSIQSYPSDFDGVVAGAPALAFNNLTSWSGTFYQLFQSAGPTGFPPPQTWPAIDTEILRQCDALDGSIDNIVETASLCNAIFRPEALICGPNPTNTSTCITGPQASALRSLFSPTHGLNGSLIYPSLPATPGVAALAYSFYAPEPFLYTSDWYKYAVYNNPTFDAATLTPADWAYAWKLNPGDSNTWSGDLSAFRARGGKVLTYHGQSDGIITPLNSERYYNHVARTMGLRSEELDEFYRFFRISGCGHCAGGDGAWSIGQAGGQAVGEGGIRPEENVLMAVVRWVEEGVPPEVVVGTKWAEEEGGGRVVEYKRAHCRYPLRNVLEGGEWRCV